MSTHKQSGVEQWFQRNCSWVVPRKSPPNSTTEHPDTPDANVPSTSTGSVSRPTRPLPATPAQGTSCVDLQSNVFMNQPSTAGPTGIGEHIGHASCIDRGMFLRHFTKSAPKFLPLRALYPYKNVRRMVHQPISLEQVGRSVS
jgi:hypothetical protein